jgi:16S rRNA processing protein RimM
VSSVVHGPAQDLLAVSTERGERLVPLVKEIVVEVDVRARRVVIHPPAGLLD